jgi:hypothetical protein
LKGETTYPDALSELTRRHEQRNVVAARAKSWDANARWVELLQILLHVAGRATAAGLNQPQLTVLLSCYDELNMTGKAPKEVLGAALPMLYSYLESTWKAGALSIWGLSALGRSLTVTELTSTSLRMDRRRRVG